MRWSTWLMVNADILPTLRCVLRLVPPSRPTLCEPLDCSPPGFSLSTGCSRQAYWSGEPFSSAGDLPDAGIKFGSPALQADSLLPEPPGKPSGCQKPASCMPASRYHMQRRVGWEEGFSRLISVPAIWKSRILGWTQCPFQCVQYEVEHNVPQTQWFE